MQSKINKQGRDNILSPEESEKVLQLLHKDAEQCYSHYQEMLNEDEQGNVLNEDNPSLARELARMNLTLNYYTEWYWKINLHNLLHFVALRADEHAQYEIRVYADEILKIIEAWVPYTAEAFKEYKIYGVNISRKAIEVIKKLIRGEHVDLASSNMTSREWNELMQVLEKR